MCLCVCLCLRARVRVRVCARQVAEGLSHRYVMHTEGVVWRGDDMRVRPPLVKQRLMAALRSDSDDAQETPPPPTTTTTTTPMLMPTLAGLGNGDRDG